MSRVVSLWFCMDAGAVLSYCTILYMPIRKVYVMLGTLQEASVLRSVFCCFNAQYFDRSSSCIVSACDWICYLLYEGLSDQNHYTVSLLHIPNKMLQKAKLQYINI